MLAIIGPALELLVLILTEIFGYAARSRKRTEEEQKQIAKEIKAAVEAIKTSLTQKRDVNSTIGDLDQRIEDETRKH
jgi:septal ring factor EnvC (AmiA/AmiB activator)